MKVLSLFHWIFGPEVSLELYIFIYFPIHSRFLVINYHSNTHMKNDKMEVKFTFLTSLRTCNYASSNPRLNKQLLKK